MWMNHIQEAQMYRELYGTIIKGMLQQRGAKGKFASQINKTRNYLSNLTDPFNIRVPGPETAQAISIHLPLSSEDRRLVYAAMLLAHEQRLAAQRLLIEQKYRDSCISKDVDQIRELHHQAEFAQTATLRQSTYPLVFELASLLFTHIDPRQHLESFLEVGCVLHDTASVLDHHAISLWAARLMRIALDTVTEHTQTRFERYEWMQINVLRAEAVSLHNLKLEKASARLAESICDHPLLRVQSAFWLPHVIRDALNALSQTPRFSLRHAEHLAHIAYRACDASHDHNALLFKIMIDHSLARAYVNYGNLAKAAYTIRTAFDQFDQVWLKGPLHYVRLLRIDADIRYRQNDQQTAQLLLQQALTIAQTGALEHQAIQIKHNLTALGVDP